MIQKFEIGDEVAVLDEAISGKVISVNSTEICIETTDGFLMKFFTKELVKRIDMVAFGEPIALVELFTALHAKPVPSPSYKICE